MASFSPSEVAMTGFGVVRRNPQAVLIWAAVYIVFQLGLSFLMISQFGPLLTELQSLKSTQSAADGAHALTIVGKLAPLYALMVVFVLPYMAVIAALMNRIVLRPDDSAFGFLRFGADEFRQIGLALFSFAVLIGGYIAFAIVTILIVVIGALLTKAMGGFGGGLFIFLGIAAEIIVAIAILLRLSLASALTFDKKKVELFGSWALTKGHAWSILGAHFLATIIYLLVLIIGAIAVFGVAAAVGGGDLMQVFSPKMGSIPEYFTPARLVQILLGAPLSAIALPIIYTVSPAIYQALTKPEY